jgi:hypothetical protein
MTLALAAWWRLFIRVWRQRAARLGTSALHVCCLLLWLGTARSVSASELAIDWRAPPECPDQAELVSRVSRLLGGVVKSNLTAATDVTRAGDAYRARLRITSSAGFGERTLENTRCEILTDSVALVIALSAAPSPGLKSDGETAQGGEDLALAVSAHGTAVSGPLPRVAVGVGGALAVEALSALRFELSGTYYGGQSKAFDQTTLGGNFNLLRFGARGCRIWSFGAFAFGPCLGAEIYYLTASGFGGVAKHDGEAIVWGPALGVFGRLRLLTAFAIYLAADGVAPVSRRVFVFSDVVGPLHRTSAVAFQLFIAPEVRF